MMSASAPVARRSDISMASVVSAWGPTKTPTVRESTQVTTMSRVDDDADGQHARDGRLRTATAQTNWNQPARGEEQAVEPVRVEVGAGHGEVDRRRAERQGGQPPGQVLAQRTRPVWPSPVRVGRSVRSSRFPPRADGSPPGRDGSHALSVCLGARMKRVLRRIVARQVAPVRSDAPSETLGCRPRRPQNRRRTGTWACSTARSPSSPARATASAGVTPWSWPSEGAKVVVNDLGTRSTARARARTPTSPSTSSRSGAARRSPTTTTWPTSTAPGAMVAAGHRRLRPARHPRQQRRHRPRRHDLER